MLLAAQFGHSLSAPAELRHGLERALPPTGLRSDVILVASELVTNAVLHGGDPIVVRARFVNDRVRLEVTDTNPDMGPPTPESRGLDIIGRLAAAWGVDLCAGGKTVWVEIAERQPIGGASTSSSTRSTMP